MRLGLRFGVLLCLLASLVAVQAGTLSWTNSNSKSITDYSTVSTTITVSGIPTTMSSYANVRIQLKLIHTFPGDLEIKLYNPGTWAWIGDNYGDTCDNYYNDISIADSHSWKIGSTFSTCPVGDKAPQESFNYWLRTANPNGEWRLQIQDTRDYDSGTLYFWTLFLEDGCYGSPCKNGGTCTATGTHTFSCACPAGLTGATCETDVNECSSNPCSPNALCGNTFGGYTCNCKSGFTGNGITCTDVDECASGSPCPVNALCTNNQGSYTCACKPGYSGDGTTCTNINECSSNPCNTNANCTDTQGSYTCTCKTGYSGNGFTCTNINECSTNPCSTNANCVDTQGSFTCTCKSGYSGNGVTCTDINECTTGTPCDTNANCINTQGSFSCSCKTGYTGVGTPGQCADLNECSLGTHNCDTNANCANTQGSYTCSCKSGYEGAGTTGNCANINECTRGTYSCDANATCIDNVGSYSCMCKPGFSGSGAVGHCADINECFLGTFSCGQHALCSNTVGSYLCYCPNGFEGDGQTCTDVDECDAEPGPCLVTETCTNTVGSYSCDDSDECALGTDNCSPDAICTNTEEGFSCTCKSGYEGDGVNCTNINECGTNPCYANSVCADTIGSYNCICNPGFYKSGNSCLNWNECNNEGPGNNCSANALCTDNQGGFNCSCKSGFDGNGYTCTDIDECSQQPYPCHSNATCSNSQGSYRCTCKPGFSGDGHSCTDLNECAGQNGGNQCDAEADCHNLPGSYSCACRTGFIGSGFNCTDVNECMEGNFTCDPNSACSNTVGSYSCICNPGFYPNGSACIDYNECANEGTQNQCSSDAICINTPGSYGCSCKSGYTGDGFSCADDDECALGEDNCDANAVCTNSLGSFGCTCLEKYVGDGVSCYLKPLPLLASRTSFSAVVEWESIVEASAYRLVVKNPSDTVVFDGYFGPGTGQAQVSSLAAFTKYTVELHTFVLGNSTSSSERLSFTTDPAPLSALAIDSLTYRSITFRFQLSEGATEYLASISLRNGTFLRTRFLSVVELAGTKRSAPVALGTLDTLEANTGYNITVFAGTETTGNSIVFTSAPLAATNLSGRRYDDTGIKLQWRNSEGTTQNTVLRNDVNGTLLASYNMTSSVADMTYIVPGLQSGVTYQFVVYSGNSDGVDFSVGPSISASTDTVFCDAVDSEGTTWDGIFYPSIQYGRCHEGYGGKPTRQCLITGQFGKIESPCVKLPDPLEGPIEVDAYSSTAIATWQREECKSFNAYMVVGDMEVSVNNGQGIGLTQPTITIGALVPLVNFTMKVYCGNEGGFERIGKAVSFMTNIPVPVVSASGVTASSVNLTWEQDSYAEWYRISYRDEEGEFTDLESRLQGTSLFVEDLSPAVNYTFRVYAGHQNTHEPHGTQLTVRTLGGSDKAAGGPLPLGAIVGIAIGGFLAIVLIVALVLVAVVFKQSKRTKQLKTIVEHERSIRSESTNQDNITLKRRQSTSSRRSSVADATLLNTAMEISVPGFLMLSGDQYRIEGPLGSGGAATVFRGTLFDPQLVKQHGTTEIAIKRIEKSPRLSEEENKERFLQEVSIMWSCTFHQNVVKLVGYSPQDSLVITKLYQMDLYGLVHHPTEQISSLLALKLAGDIASAMAYVQEIGIVHRDLKTSNVLLEEVDVGGGRTMLKAVVCDFGLARITSSATTLENLKLKEIGGFSPRYAAPEVFSAASAKIVTDAEQDKKSDVYSFAIIVWELLTRRVPWDGLPYEQIEYQVRSGARPVPPAVIPSDPAHVFLVELMAACWHESPGQRPPFGAIHTKISSLL